MRLARLGLALAVLLGSAAQAARDTDVIVRAFPACATLRDAMQAECWTPLTLLNARGEPLVDGSPLDNRCDAIYRAALVACPAWPRTPRTAGWRIWYRRVRMGWRLPADAASPDTRPGCVNDPDDCG